MLMITSSPVPDSESSVTSMWRLSCQRPTTFALSRTFVHAVLDNNLWPASRRTFLTVIPPNTGPAGALRTLDRKSRQVHGLLFDVLLRLLNARCACRLLHLDNKASHCCE